MSLDHNKALVSWFLLDSFNQRNVEVVDEVFASDHHLHSPALETGTVEGTEAIKRMIHDYLDDVEEGARVTCTIQKQIAEGEWVTTYYTLETTNYTSEGPRNEAYWGVMISCIAHNTIQESYVVAQEVSPEERKKVFN